MHSNSHARRTRFLEASLSPPVFEDLVELYPHATTGTVRTEVAVCAWLGRAPLSAHSPFLFLEASLFDQFEPIQPEASDVELAVTSRAEISPTLLRAIAPNSTQTAVSSSGVSVDHRPVFCMRSVEDFLRAHLRKGPAKRSPEACEPHRFGRPVATTRRQGLVSRTLRILPSFPRASRSALPCNR